MRLENVAYHQNGKIKKRVGITRNDLSKKARNSYIGWEIVDVVPKQKVQLLELRGIHPDENGYIAELDKIMQVNFKIPRLKISHPHLLAARLGQRSNYVPLDMTQYITTSIINQRRGKNRKPSFLREIDLNRQYIFPENIKSFRELRQHVPYEPAQLLIDFIVDFPNLKLGVSWHQDYEREKEIYIYDIVPSKLKDKYKREIKKLMNNLRQVFKESNFQLFSGIDDLKLNNQVDDGYIYQQARNEISNSLDGSVECALVELGRKGLTNFERFITIEMPYGLNDKQMSEAIKIINNVFLIPLYKLYGAILSHNRDLAQMARAQRSER